MKAAPCPPLANEIAVDLINPAANQAADLALCQLGAGEHAESIISSGSPFAEIR
jgi:hypothetical protein